MAIGVNCLWMRVLSGICEAYTKRRARTLTRQGDLHAYFFFLPTWVLIERGKNYCAGQICLRCSCVGGICSFRVVGGQIL